MGLRAGVRALGASLTASFPFTAFGSGFAAVFAAESFATFCSGLTAVCAGLAAVFATDTFATFGAFASTCQRVGGNMCERETQEEVCVREREGDGEGRGGGG